MRSTCCSRCSECCQQRCDVLELRFCLNGAGSMHWLPQRFLLLLLVVVQC